MDEAIKTVKDLLNTIAKENQYEKSEISVTQINTGGANYSSYLFQATISSPEREDLNLFVKLAGLRRSRMREFIINAFRIETFFYTDLLKAYKCLENKHNVEPQHRLRTAKLFGYCTEEFKKLF